MFFHVVLLIYCGCYWNLTNKIYRDSTGFWCLYQLHDLQDLHSHAFPPTLRRFNSLAGEKSDVKLQPPMTGGCHGANGIEQEHGMDLSKIGLQKFSPGFEPWYGMGWNGLAYFETNPIGSHWIRCTEHLVRIVGGVHGQGLAHGSVHKCSRPVPDTSTCAEDWKPERSEHNQWDFQDPKLEVPTIYKAYVRPMFTGTSQKIWPYMVQYLHFRILEFPLTQCQFTKHSNTLQHPKLSKKNILCIHFLKRLNETYPRDSLCRCMRTCSGN